MQPFTSPIFAKRKRRTAGRNIVWVAWERHRRTRQICNSFGFELVEYHSSLPRWIKHPILAFRTLLLLAARGHATVIIQCPSVVLGVEAVLLRRFLRYRLIIDAHNEVVAPFNYTNALYRWLTRFVLRSADWVIVSNNLLRAPVEAAGGQPYVLPDRIPVLPLNSVSTKVHRYVAYVCSFARDEPYREVIEAARSLEGALEVVITGHFQRGDAEVIRAAPANVLFTGFLDDAAYIQVLRNSMAVLSLSFMDDCLLCSAYEAVALERPLITSDTRALRRHFRLGTIHTNNNPAAIVAAIRDAALRQEMLETEMKQLKRALSREWDRQAAMIEHQLTKPL